MGGILWLYQTQGLFIIYAPDTDMTDDSHGESPISYSYDLFNNLTERLYGNDFLFIGRF